MLKRIAKAMSFEPASTMKLVDLRPCQCGETNYRCGRFIDSVWCNNCGCIYYIGPCCMNPVAKFVFIANNER